MKGVIADGQVGAGALVDLGCMDAAQGEVTFSELEPAEGEE